MSLDMRLAVNFSCCKIFEIKFTQKKSYRLRPPAPSQSFRDTLWNITQCSSQRPRGTLESCRTKHPALVLCNIKHVQEEMSPGF